MTFQHLGCPADFSVVESSVATTPAAVATRKYRTRRLAEIEAMPKIECMCGCGTLIAPINRTLKPARYVQGHNPVTAETRRKLSERVGVLNGRWRGGKNMSNGYIRLLVDNDHPMSRGHRTYVYLHRLVMSEAIGRPLLQSEQVHHINGDRSDNRIENLQLIAGGHASGAAYRCCDCGSQNVLPEEIF